MPYRPSRQDTVLEYMAEYCSVIAMYEDCTWTKLSPITLINTLGVTLAYIRREVALVQHIRNSSHPIPVQRFPSHPRPTRPAHPPAVTTLDPFPLYHSNPIDRCSVSGEAP